MPHHARGPIVRTTALEKFEIGTKVKAEMWKDDRGYWHYKPGWNDEAVAQFVGQKTSRPLNKHHVIGIRREICGIMKPRTAPPETHMEPPVDRVARLGARYKQLAQAVLLLTERVEQLEQEKAHT